MIYKYVSVNEIIEGVYRDSGIQEELDIWDVIEWAGEALELIGAGVSYVDLIGEVCVENHKVKLPCNFHSLEQISYKGNPLHLCSGSFGAISTTSSGSTTNYIDGKKVETGIMSKLSCPHDHKTILGHFHQATEKEVKMAIESSLDTLLKFVNKNGKK